MSVNIYVGNLSLSVTSGDLERLFAEDGGVSSARVIVDRDSGASRGFGFVEMESDAAARAAIDAMNDTEVEGRRLQVNEARERQTRGGRQ
jgi:RNA recognition motif-containing protein